MNHKKTVVQEASPPDPTGNPKPKRDKKPGGNIEDHLKKLEDQYQKVKDIPGFEKFGRARKRLDFTLKDRYKARDEIVEVKGEFEAIKDKLKSFLREQLISSHKSGVQKTTKPKLQQ